MDTKKITEILELILKIFSVLFILSLLIGASVIWIYLYREGIVSEFTSLLASPQILVTITFYTILALFSIIGTIVIYPTLIVLSEEIHGVTENTKKWYLRFSLATTPIFLMLICAYFDVQGVYLIISLSATSLLITLLLYRLYGEIGEVEEYKIVGFSSKFFCILFAQFSLVFTLLFVIKAILFIENSNSYHWVIICIFTILYGLTTIPINTKKYFSYGLLACLSSGIFAVLFISNVHGKIVELLGIGHYKTSLSVELKYVVPLKYDKFHIIPLNKANLYTIKDVWVLANLPDKILIKATPESLSFHTIPVSAVIGEENEISLPTKSSSKTNTQD